MKQTPTFEDKVVRALVPASRAAANTTNGSTIDRLGYDHIEFMLDADVGAGSGGIVAGKLQEGDASDASDMADITGAAFTNLTSANEGTPRKGYLYGSPRKRYVRIVVTTTAQTSLSAAVCRLSGAAKEPIASPDFAILS